MQIQMTTEMLAALSNTPEIPDNLRKRVAGARQEGNTYAVTLSDDEAMAMAEMCQWYIHRDERGELTPKAALFDSIVTAIDEAQA
jgi:predicted transcriptional regulator